MSKRNTYKISKSLKQVWQWKQAVSRDLQRVDRGKVVSSVNRGSVRGSFKR